MATYEVDQETEARIEESALALGISVTAVIQRGVERVYHDVKLTKRTVDEKLETWRRKRKPLLRPKERSGKKEDKK